MAVMDDITSLPEGRRDEVHGGWAIVLGNQLAGTIIEVDKDGRGSAIRD
jgi:hypothetical protein